MTVPTVQGLQGKDAVLDLGEAYADSNVGTGKILSVIPGFLIDDGNSGNNYIVTTVSDSAGVINPAPLTITAAANTKTYNATTVAAAVPTVRGLQGSDTVSGLAEAYADPNAGTGKTLSVTPGYAVDDGNSGKNYIVTTVSNSAGVINAAPLTITATANTKTYDATAAAAAVPTAVRGLQGSDTVSGLVEAYTDPNAGTGKTLSITAYAVNDGNSGKNYIVTTVSDNAGVINAAPLTITATANTKTYAAATAAAAVPTVQGLQGSDTVSGLAEAYTDPNAGTGKTLSVVPGYTINDGNSGKNYVVTTVADNAGVITPAPLTITATTNAKTYDATIAAAAVPTVQGLQGRDTASGLAETYADPNVGTGKTLSVAPGYTINDGNSGRNYIVTTVSDETGVINPAATTTAGQSLASLADFGQEVVFMAAVSPDFVRSRLRLRQRQFRGRVHRPGPGGRSFRGKRLGEHGGGAARRRKYDHNLLRGRCKLPAEHGHVHRDGPARRLPPQPDGQRRAEPFRVCQHDDSGAGGGRLELEERAVGRRLAQLVASKILVAGGVQVKGVGVSITPQATPHAATTPDPLAALAAVTASVPAKPAAVNFTKGSHVLQPGVYSKIGASGKAVVTLQPGVYVIAGGGFSVSDSTR